MKKVVDLEAQVVVVEEALEVAYLDSFGFWFSVHILSELVFAEAPKKCAAGKVQTHCFCKNLLDILSNLRCRS